MLLCRGKRELRKAVRKKQFNSKKIALSVKETIHSCNNPRLSACFLQTMRIVNSRTRSMKVRPGTSLSKYARQNNSPQSVRGSLTVEAAFVLPLFLFAVLIMLGIFQAVQVQCGMSQALQYAARRTAVTYVTGDSPDKGLGILGARQMTVSYLKQHDAWTDAIEGGTAGISFATSDLSGEYVSLCADYRVKLPVTIWGIRSLPVSQCARARKWIGWTDSSAGDGSSAAGKVYVTEYGTAYHKSLSCPYLDLSIHAVSVRDVSERRNKDGKKYSACSCSRHSSGTVYITDYGTEYHASLSCSHLSRTIHTVDQESAGAYHACPKCAGEEQ